MLIYLIPVQPTIRLSITPNRIYESSLCIKVKNFKKRVLVGYWVTTHIPFLQFYLCIFWNGQKIELARSFLRGRGTKQ